MVVIGLCLWEVFIFSEEENIFVGGKVGKKTFHFLFLCHCAFQWFIQIVVEYYCLIIALITVLPYSIVYLLDVLIVVTRRNT